MSKTATQAPEQGEKISAPPRIAWDAESIRFSAFAPPGIQWKPTALFATIAGQDPVRIVERPQQGVRQEVGDLGGGAIVVIAQAPRRVDIVLSLDSAVAATQPIVQLGPFADWSAKHKPLVEAWLSTMSELSRIAYGPTFIKQTESSASALAGLNNLLPGVDLRPGIADPRSMRDVLWQVNRPRPSNVIPGLMINRLQKWALVEIGLAEVEGGAISAMPPVPAMRLELDINTAPEYKEPLAAAELPKLWLELHKVAIEIAEKGDAP